MITKNPKLKTLKYYSLLNVIYRINTLAVLFVTFHFALFTLHLNEVHAQGVNLKLSPSVLQIQVVAPTTINAPISIENFGDQSVDLKNEFRLFRTSDKDNGQIEHFSLKENNSVIFSKVSLLDGGNNLSKITLGPKQKKDLNLRILINEDEAPGDHYFSIIFTSVQDSFQPVASSNEQQSISKINLGIAMNVILSIQEPVEKDSEPKITASIEEFSTSKFIERGPVPFTIGIKNNGNHFIRPKGTIEITNMFGQLIGKIDVPSTNILAQSRRYLESTNTQEKTSDISSGSKNDSVDLIPKILWKEDFLLGFYTAKLKIEASPGSPTLSQTIHFTALPFRLIITIIATIIMFLIIRKRVKKKMSQR